MREAGTEIAGIASKQTPVIECDFALRKETQITGNVSKQAATLECDLPGRMDSLNGDVPGELIFYAPEFDGPTVILMIDGVDHAVDNITNPVPTDKPGEYSFEII